MNIFLGENVTIAQLKDSQVPVIDLIKPLIAIENKSLDDCLRSYGDYFQNLNIVDDISQADFGVLPYAWNYYYQSKKLNEVKDLLMYCKSKNKKVYTVTTGDYGVTPTSKDMYVLRQSGYQSMRLKHQHALPVFISDPLLSINNGKIAVKNKQEKPIVGFCGQGKSSSFSYTYSFMSNVWKNLTYHLSQSIYEPQCIYPSTYRRNKVLNSLSKNDKVNANFIIRTKYRGGATTEIERQKSRKEFFNNIFSSDYTLCVRGAGNFSVRIYETLAMGRIPLFINTDCILPLDHIIDWKSHVVWVEEAEIKHINELLTDFHQSIHKDDFIQMQINNRELWEKYLSFGGFHKHICNMLNN